MGYQALLFCPEEKTARTVTQVLSELEFSVDSSSEPFAAVKKLMAEHFDAVVVDCDNEQNATLLFKSARNSTANQASLAVAVVEGQAGVAKAFRIGANLVLTKPINVEQAKGTLRVARGLLRKGDPSKAAAPVSTTPAPAKTSSTAPSAPFKPTPAIAISTGSRPEVSAPPRNPAGPAGKPFHTATVKASSPTPVAQSPSPTEPDVLEVDAEAPASAPVAPPAYKGVPSPPFSTTSAPFPGVKSSGPAHSGISSSSAGAAVAPARAAQEPKFEPPVSASATKTLDLDNGGSQASESHVPAPSFTFGGANVPESKARGTKAMIGVAALVIGAGLYFGWTKLHGKSESPSPVAQQSVPASNTASPMQASMPQPFSTGSRESSALAASSPPTHTTTSSNSSLEKPGTDFATNDSEPVPAKSGTSVRNSPKGGSTESTPVKSPAEDKPPLMVKNGTAATAHLKPASGADTPAPSVLGIATASSDGGLPNLVVNQDAPKPVLQSLNVSQGVSQGLLIKKVQPNYPPTALRMHVEGSVQLMATIGRSGTISAVKVVSGEPLLAQAALDAVKQWKYKPYYLNGDPVEIQTQITVNFKLPR